VGYIGYCSSDLFSGTSPADDNEVGRNFLGNYILWNAIEALLTSHELDQASEILITGMGGSAQALFAQVDDLTDQLRAGLNDPNISIRALSDSGWRTDREPYDPTRASCDNVTDSNQCTFKAGITVGIDLWQPEYPSICQAFNFTWECFFPHYFFTNVETDMFVFIYEYDWAQTSTDGANLNGSDVDALAYEQDEAQALIENEILPSVTSGFFPGCWNHEIINTADIYTVSLNNQSFYEALTAWWLYDANEIDYDADWIVESNPTCTEFIPPE
jgi:hypothetical protein